MTADFFRSTAAAVLAALIFTSCGTEVPDSQSMERRQAAAAAQQASTEATTAAVTTAATVPTTEAETEQFTLDVSVPEKYEMPVSCGQGSYAEAGAAYGL